MAMNRNIVLLFFLVTVFMLQLKLCCWRKIGRVGNCLGKNNKVDNATRLARETHSRIRLTRPTSSFSSWGTPQNTQELGGLVLCPIKANARDCYLAAFGWLDFTYAQTV
jgi:hypothetical protein